MKTIKQLFDIPVFRQHTYGFTHIPYVGVNSIYRPRILGKIIVRHAFRVRFNFLDKLDNF
jgi:hypothetical protein